MDDGQGVILLTDMFGGTPSNLAISVMEETQAEVIAGLNLPMLIKLASVRDRENLQDLRRLRPGGRAQVHLRRLLRDGGGEVSGEPRLSSIVNQRGLHARASAKFVKMAAGFDAEVTVSRDGQSIDAQSIMGLMMLAAGPGAEIELKADGPEAQEAVDALANLIDCKFEEER